MKITSGPNKGYYSLPTVELNDGSPVRTDTPYSRLKLKPTQQILGFNSTYLPYIDGYYYVPTTPGLDIRKTIYALETKRVPSSGNTETFLRDFKNNTASIPTDYCPYYLDPCNYDWCGPCYNKTAHPKQFRTRFGNYINHYVSHFVIFLCFFVISFIIVMAFRS